VTSGDGAVTATGSGSADVRYHSERQFHDHAFEHGTRSKVSGFYRVLEHCSTAYGERLGALTGAGVEVLEYGCGVGTDAFSLAGRGAVVSAIDISAEGIRQTAARAETEGLRVDCRQMNAEALEFDAGSFDVVCGRGILHHLDLRRGYDELRRVLRPGGVGLFMEPLGHNPLINVFRRATPSLRTPDEHPLVLADFELAERYFGRVEVAFYGLFPLLALPVPASGFKDRLVRRLCALDTAVLPRMGRAGAMAWYAVIELSAPRAS